MAGVPRTATKPAAAERRIDTSWFHDRIRESPFRSLRELAQHMRNGFGRPFSIRAMSTLLAGKRYMRIGDARQIADLLHLRLSEVLRRAGVDARDEQDDLEERHRAAVRTVRTLLGFIDEAGVQLPAKVRAAATAIA